MTKTRLEAFSDGVFAIIITLMILDIRLPEVDYDHLPQALLQVLPKIFAYVMSFIIIGLYWISHHNSFQVVKKTDGSFLWLNVLLLLTISFIPFPTALIGRYPFKALPVIIYGATLMACNLTAFLMVSYIRRHPELAEEDRLEGFYRRQIPVYLYVNTSYVLAICLSGLSAWISYFIYAGITAYMIRNTIKQLRDPDCFIFKPGIAKRKQPEPDVLS